MAVDVASKYINHSSRDVPITSPEASQIQSMFAGSTVLVTGGTGFLGKLLIEKLLRSCPDLRRIYLLARPKKNKTVTERLQEQFSDVIYDKLRKEFPDFLNKITIVEGDVGMLNIGISEEDRIKLTQEVEFIFHGAATVRFDESLKVATEINVRGSREMLYLARSCTKLRAYVHTSTAYSNCVQREIEEKLYNMPLSAEKLIDLVETMDEATLNNITPALLGDYPNTYAFTKSAAEHIVRSYSKGLPVAIYRPAIVVSTAKEPIPGWIDNVYGPTGVVVGAAVGLMHVLHCDEKAVADLVPADLTCNASIAIAWKTARDYTGNHEDAPPLDQDPTIYNYVSSVQKPLMWKMFMKYTEIYGINIAPVCAMWCYIFFLVKSKLLYTILFYLLHWLPAYIVDGFAMAVGKKPMLRKAYTKIEKFSLVISYFATREWHFTNNNIESLFQDLSDVDKKIFDFDMSSFDWDEYFKSYTLGIKLYLLKEPVDTIEAGLKRQQRLRWLHFTVCGILLLCLCRLLLAIYRIF